MIINQAHPIKRSAIRYSIFEWIWMQKRSYCLYTWEICTKQPLSGAELVRFLERFLSLHSLPRRH